MPVRKKFMPNMGKADRLKPVKNVVPKIEMVTHVIDGDTFKTAERKEAIRLESVSAPEHGQPGAKETTKGLANLVLGQKVEIKVVAQDSYGRAVARVKVGRRSVNNHMKAKIKKLEPPALVRQKVTRIIDGDTFEVANGENLVRLANVCAPELGEPASRGAIQALKELILGKTVGVSAVSRDLYGREVAMVTIDGKSVNEHMEDVVENLYS